jgi:hypothetical protein
MGLGTGATAAIIGGIGAAGSLGSSIIGAHAAGSAADTQVNAENKVLDLLKTLTPQEQAAIESGVSGANSTLGATYNENLGLLKPYLSSGTTALAQLNALTGGGGFQAPTSVTEQNDPGYQFRMEQGDLAQQRSAAAAGGVLGGGEAKALQQYSQGLASNEYGNVYNRALGTYQTNFGNLQSLANLGMGATNTGVSAGNILGSQEASNTLQGGFGTAGVLGQNFGSTATALTGAADASAAGTIGKANAWSGGLTNGTSNLSNMLMLQQLLGNGGSSYKPITKANPNVGGSAPTMFQ